MLVLTCLCTQRQHAGTAIAADRRRTWNVRSSVTAFDLSPEESRTTGERSRSPDNLTD